MCHSQVLWVAESRDALLMWSRDRVPSKSAEERPLHSHRPLSATSHLCQQPEKPSMNNEAQGGHFSLYTQGPWLLQRGLWDVSKTLPSVLLGCRREGWRYFWMVAHPSVICVRCHHTIPGSESL